MPVPARLWAAGGGGSVRCGGHALRAPRSLRCFARGAAAGLTPRTASQDAAGGVDVVLSSGFLAFAAHAGVLAAVDDAGLRVRAVCGTSSGAMVGSLYAAGFSPREIAEEFSRVPPIRRVRPARHPLRGRGLLTLEPAAAELRRLLPARFEDLPALRCPFGATVVDARGRHVLVRSGALADAVVASAAVPLLFQRVPVAGLPGGPFVDGGLRCRVGLALWRRERYGAGAGAGAAPPALVHLVGRSSPFSGADGAGRLRGAAVVRSPRARASLWGLGGFGADFEAARRRAAPVVAELLAAAG